MTTKKTQKSETENVPVTTSNKSKSKEYNKVSTMIYLGQTFTDKKSGFTTKYGTIFSNGLPAYLESLCKIDLELAQNVVPVTEAGHFMRHKRNKKGR